MRNPESNLRPQKLLIADDSAEMRRLLRRICVHAFADICECADGEQAVALFAEQRPDCVLMDIAMPRLDGLAAMAQILAREPTARVIIVSQHDGASFRQAAAQAGASGFVSKNHLEPLHGLIGAQPRPSDAAPSEGRSLPSLTTATDPGKDHEK